MTTKSFGLGSFAYQAGPVLWGSLQDVGGLTAIDKAAPFLVVQDMPGIKFVADNKGRLTEVNLTSGKSVHYSFDNAGNRVTVTTA